MENAYIPFPSKVLDVMEIYWAGKEILVNTGL